MRSRFPFPLWFRIGHVICSIPNCSQNWVNTSLMNTVQGSVRLLFGTSPFLHFGTDQRSLTLNLRWVPLRPLFFLFLSVSACILGSYLIGGTAHINELGQRLVDECGATKCLLSSIALRHGQDIRSGANTISSTSKTEVKQADCPFRKSRGRR